MKTIEISVGNFNVQVSMNPVPHEHRVEMSATIGNTTVGGVLKLQSTHDHSADQFAKDVQAFALRLATEAAGNERGRTLIEEHFK